MTYSLEVIVNTGQFEHAKLTINAKTEAELNKLMDLSDETVRSVGTFGLAVKSQVLYGRDNPAGAPAASPEQLIEEELGGKILEVTEHRPAPAWAVTMEPETKAWDKPESEPDPEPDPKVEVEKPGDDW